MTHISHIGTLHSQVNGLLLACVCVVCFVLLTVIGSFSSAQLAFATNSVGILGMGAVLLSGLLSIKFVSFWSFQFFHRNKGEIRDFCGFADVVVGKCTYGAAAVSPSDISHLQLPPLLCQVAGLLLHNQLLFALQMRDYYWGSALVGDVAARQRSKHCEFVLSIACYNPTKDVSMIVHIRLLLFSNDN